MNAAEPQPPALTRIVAELREDDVDQPAATLRLRQAIGEDLARQLLRALAGDHRRAGLGGVQS